MKPNFLVIGAAKCGTTSLCGLLGSHPDVFMTEPKELNFFAYDELYARGTAWYESFFAQANGCRARGEGSPLYTLSGIYPDAPARIAMYDPKMKLIFIARHPLDRIETAWFEIRSWGDETVLADFNAALRKNRDWLIDTSLYWNEISKYRECFTDEQILVLFFEDFAQDWRAVLKRCYEFLGVDPAIEADPSLQELNRSADKRIRRGSVSALRALPGAGAAFALAKTLLPEFVRAPLRHYVLNARVTSRPVWSPDSRQWVIRELLDDADKFLAFYRGGEDPWNLRGELERLQQPTS